MKHLINDVVFLYQHAIIEVKTCFLNHLQDDKYHELLICTSHHPLLYPTDLFLEHQLEKINILKDLSSSLSFSELKLTCFVFSSEIEFALKNLHPLRMRETLSFLNTFLDEMCDYLDFKINNSKKHLA